MTRSATPLPWRDYLTPADWWMLDKIDAAKANWLKLNRARYKIVNRAIARAKRAAKPCLSAR